MPAIHPTAIVDRRSELASDVVVGPYAIVEAGVQLGAGCALHAHAVVRGLAVLGARNVVHPFAVVGGEPQAKHRAEGPARLQVGEGNVFREHATVHGGTDGRTTRIGDDNLFMVGSHVAHDGVVGSKCVFANGVQLAGHAVIEDWVTFGGLSGVTQRVRVGESAFVAATAACERDVPPFVVVQGDRARVRGLNSVGLRRRGVPEESIAALERIVKTVWMSRHTRAEALVVIAERAGSEGDTDAYAKRLVAFLR
ncbi:MAG: acyl-ACP--UDP-N-acetylglucosamine O-acyltransferase [Polyangiaceae bacterium]